MATEVYRPGIKRSWFALSYDEEKSAADLYLYDDIGFFGITANDVKEQLLSVNAERIDVYINSNGGEIDAGLAIYNMLKRHKAEKVIHIDGIAASMASVIAMAGDKVVMPETAMMFVHKPWTMTAGNADDFQRTAEQLDKWETALVAAYAEKTGLPAATISEMLKDERLLSASEAIELGFADELSEADEPAFAYRGAMTCKVLCHLAKRNQEIRNMSEEVVEQEAAEVVEEVVTDESAAEVAEQVEQEQPVDEQPEPAAAEDQIDARAEFKQFVARFGAVRAASYFEEGLAYADAERRFTDELIAENEALKAKASKEESPARPVGVKPSDPESGITFDEAYAKAKTPAEKRSVYLKFHNKE